MGMQRVKDVQRITRVQQAQGEYRAVFRVPAAGLAQVGGSLSLFPAGRVVTPVPPGGGICHEPLGFKPCSPLAALFSLSCTSQQPKCCSGVLAHHGTPRHATAAGTLPTWPVPTARPRGPQAPQQRASPGLMLLHAEPQSLPAAPVLLASA